MSVEVKACVKTIRVTPRKVRLVVDLIRGKDVNEAFAILEYTNKKSSEIVKKLVKSAASNATHNNNLNGDKLYIKKIYVDEGPTLKRFRPRAKGSAASILKRTSHITVVVAER